MSAPVVAAALRRKERAVIDDFRATGAISPSTAQSYTAMGLGETLAVKRLYDRAVIREGSPGKYYLDEVVWTAVRRTRWRIAFVMIGIIAILLLGFLAGTTF